ncbi:SDR family oxidoreductase [Streptomyces sp. NPDC020883]|uniref:SDR family oxidoreductase n=1 Tax=Streptomyces sp. NPDC020883 TaxID=3365099 RepID=UPI0037953596
MLIVTGATGRLGELIVNRLLERVPAERIGVSMRDVSKAADLAASSWTTTSGSPQQSPAGYRGKLRSSP